MGAFMGDVCSLSCRYENEMKSDLDHLPPHKQDELAHVVRVLFEEFAQAIGGATQPWKKAGRILKIILYGSYARGDWVDDPVGGYKSDYDILIIVNDERLTDVLDYWSAADDRLMRDTTISGILTAPVHFIVHSFKDVNKQLEQGRPFFIDIVEQGIALYEAEAFGLTAHRTLSIEKARAEAKKHFEYWFEQADSARLGANFYIESGKVRDAAFLMHQATERLYHCTLLVLTLYSPKSHRLNFLRSRCEEVAPELIAAWPRDDKFSRRCFELLRLAYVNARYSPQFKISNEELDWLGARIAILQKLVCKVCAQRLMA